MNKYQILYVYNPDLWERVSEKKGNKINIMYKSINFFHSFFFPSFIVYRCPSFRAGKSENSKQRKTPFKHKRKTFRAFNNSKFSFMNNKTESKHIKKLIMITFD